ncbi:MAG: beta-ketoacyl-ACP synthase [Cellvibrionaceae bacterium]|nr:beta-ketoacyl-ACP synthase [Cellvibrionaceae bacterium]
MDIRLVDYESTSAAGINTAARRLAVANYTSGLRPNDLPGANVNTWIGRVPQLEAVDDLGPWQSRNNALAALGLAQGSLRHSIDRLISRLGAARIGVVIGSSTSSIDRTETAYQHLHPEDGSLKTPFQQPLVHNPGAPSLFVAHYTGISGPAITINTACSSSAKVFATAARWLQSGIVDAVLAGGVDTLCLSVIHGFDALQLVSADICKPFDQERSGINLGEAAGFALLCRSTSTDILQQTDSPGRQIQLCGYGESSDAYHMSHPHPEGLGARRAMEQALAMAGLSPEQIDYINLHGTASQANDLIEGQLISALFPASTQCSSTKAWTGHTLGAAGITEALIAIDALETDLTPGSMNLDQLDTRLSFSISPEHQRRDNRCVMSNSFGFGGNNCSLIFAEVEQS